jgi:phosphatidylglycerophosphate synthase
MSNIDDKYGDDELFESWSDNNIFIPIAKQLVDPVYNLGMTPNMVTVTSTFFTMYSIYLLHQEERIYASLSYLLGYLLDCVDGRLARKYSMSSDIGMALDCVSDNVSNFILFGYILLTRPFNQKTIIFMILIIYMLYMLSISYGINEAIASYDVTKDDNFYNRRYQQLKDKIEISCGGEKMLYLLFLTITNLSYSTYHKEYPNYDREKLNGKSKTMKEFAPGNFTLFIAISLLYI